MEEVHHEDRARVERDTCYLSSLPWRVQNTEEAEGRPPRFPLASRTESRFVTRSLLSRSTGITPVQTIPTEVLFVPTPVKSHPLSYTVVHKSSTNTGDDRTRNRPSQKIPTHDAERLKEVRRRISCNLKTTDSIRVLSREWRLGQSKEETFTFYLFSFSWFTLFKHISV